MRRFTIIAFVLLVVFFAVQAQAQVCFPSGNKTADAALYGFSTGLYADMTVGGGGSCTYNVGRRSGR